MAGLNSASAEDFNKGEIMKNISIFSVLIGIFLLAHPGPFVFAAPANENFAVVDIGKVFDEYEKTKKYDEQFQGEGRAKQEERDAIVREVRRLRDEQALLDKDARAQKQATVDAKLKELETFDEEARKGLGEKRNTAVKEVFQDIENTIRQYGERKGYDFVLNDRALLYRNKKYDVTADVLNELNKNYQKKN